MSIQFRPGVTLRGSGRCVAEAGNMRSRDDYATLAPRHTGRHCARPGRLTRPPLNRQAANGSAGRVRGARLASRPLIPPVLLFRSHAIIPWGRQVNRQLVCQFRRPGGSGNGRLFVVRRGRNRDRSGPPRRPTTRPAFRDVPTHQQRRKSAHTRHGRLGVWSLVGEGYATLSDRSVPARA